MKKSKYWLLLSNLLALVIASRSWAISSQTQDGSVVMTKSLWGAPGNAHLTNASGVSVGFAWGEPASGYEITSGVGAAAMIGYYGGRSSSSGAAVPIKIARILAESIGPVVNKVQLGSLMKGTVKIDLVDPIQGANLYPNISISLVQDHLGQVQNNEVPYYITYVPAGKTVDVNSQFGWLGDSLYEVTITNALQSSDGFKTPSTMHYRFVTLMDPIQENVVYTPVDAPQAAAAAGGTAGDPANQALRVDLSPGASKDFSFLLSNDSPDSRPLQVDPQAIVDANRKIAAAQGPYSKPIALQELVLFNTQVQPVAALSAPARISWPYASQSGLLTGIRTPVRPETLAVYSLDIEHHLWVRLPASSGDGRTQTMNVSINKLSVFALMGSGDATTTFTTVFPVPWRPHGPNAGDGSGQTGTESGGITFTNLPPECTIRIYTISGDRVVEIHHSDASLTGPNQSQETWLGLTSGGAHVASGVYLWEVLSSVDKKTGKLIIIR